MNYFYKCFLITMKIKKFTNSLKKNFHKNKPYSIPKINSIIKKTYCKQTDEQLSDTNLMNDFLLSKSSQRKIDTLKTRLESLNLSKSHINSIINDNLILNEFCIAPGTKGVIRGNTFNKIVQDKIIEIGKKINNGTLTTPDFEIEFEKKIGNYTHEIPDWYIREKSSGKVIIGMNQIDLWSGGQQTNRGSKYILNDDFHKNETVKIISVISKFVELDSYNNKVFKIFEKGLKLDRLCYVYKLGNIIYIFFY